jgi:long-chain acyl-CoA synthetase
MPHSSTAPVSTSPVLVHEFLSTSAARRPEAIAVLEPTRRITYADLDAEANRFARLLWQRGVQRGDRVVLAIDNSIDLVAAYFGTLRAGAVAVPLPPGPRSDRLIAAVGDCVPAACLVDAATARDAAMGRALAAVPHRFVRAAAAPPGQPGFEPLRGALGAVAAEPPPVRIIDSDLAAIIYTSGSTGAPRGVMLRHVNLRANTISIVEYLALTARDRIMCVLPLYYVYGLSLLHTHVLVGGSIVLDNRFAFPNVVVAAMNEQEVTGFAGVPSSFTLLLHRSNLPETAFPTLRYVTQAGGAMPPARIREWLERGPRVPFYVMYGATEASARLCYLAPEHLERKLGSIGRPIPNVEMQVIREDGRPAGPGEVGELVARGANIALGYWNSPDETAERFSRHAFRTGDLAYADDDGFLFIVGRLHDMIKVGAHRVGAKEIEDVLCEHPGVHEAAVVGAVHDLLGEAPVAFVSPRTGASLTEVDVQHFCKERLAPHKVPVRVLLRSELPKMGMGKTDRAALRAEVASFALNAGGADKGSERP